MAHILSSEEKKFIANVINNTINGPVCIVVGADLTIVRTESMGDYTYSIIERSTEDLMGTLTKYPNNHIFGQLSLNGNIDTTDYDSDLNSFITALKT
jgi:hypothetical protein|tara:strand:+ start:270 stop:560 length:291 start_codon:yes stop_codon:yes gene_type:complete